MKRKIEREKARWECMGKWASVHRQRRGCETIRRQKSCSKCNNIICSVSGGHHERQQSLAEIENPAFCSQFMGGASQKVP